MQNIRPTHQTKTKATYESHKSQTQCKKKKKKHCNRPTNTTPIDRPVPSCIALKTCWFVIACSMFATVPRTLCSIFSCLATISSSFFRYRRSGNTSAWMSEGVKEGGSKSMRECMRLQVIASDNEFDTAKYRCVCIIYI